MTGAIVGALAALILALLTWEMVERHRLARARRRAFDRVGIVPPYPRPAPLRFPRLTFASLWSALGMVILGGSVGWAWAEYGEVSTPTVVLGVLAAGCFLGAVRNGGLR